MNYSYEIIPYEEMIKPQSSFTEVISKRELPKKRESLKCNPGKNKHLKKPTKKRHKVRRDWKENQQANYALFLANNLEIMQKSIEQRKKYCVNVMMSALIKTRTQKQCHSHHQKMMKKYGTLQGIINAILPQLPYPKVLKQASAKKRLENQLSKIEEEVKKNEVSINSFREKDQFELAPFDIG